MIVKVIYFNLDESNGLNSFDKVDAKICKYITIEEIELFNNINLTEYEFKRYEMMMDELNFTTFDYNSNRYLIYNEPEDYIMNTITKLLRDIRIHSISI